MTSLLIVDDDQTFCEVLAESFAKLGHEVKTANNIAQAVSVSEIFNPEWVVVDLKIKRESGLQLIHKLLEIDPQTKIVVLTGYASVTTAIEAIKLGAVHYLAKPVSTAEIIAAFHKQEGNPQTPVETETLKLSQAEREHIMSAYERNQRNISATARELGMHRRTLQRKLNKIL